MITGPVYVLSSAGQSRLRHCLVHFVHVGLVENHARITVVAEQRDDTRTLADHRAHAVQRQIAEENVEIPEPGA